MFTVTPVGTLAPPVSSVIEKSEAATVASSTFPSKVTFTDLLLALSFLSVESYSFPVTAVERVGITWSIFT